MGNTAQLANLGGAYAAGGINNFKNRIINGNMAIDQRNAGASITPINTQFSVDRWGCYLTQASKYSVQQNAGAVTPPAGFTNYVGVTSLSAFSVGVNDTFFLYQRIEGYNIADLGWGAAGAQPVTLSFWVRSSLTGSFGGSLDNSAANYSYPFSYTISSANTWEYKTIVIPGPTSGGWNITNGQGIELRLNLGSGNTFLGTANTWAAANYVTPTGSTSVVGTNGATLYITGVQLEKGSTATSFDYRPYGTELALCQRYYEYSVSANCIFLHQARNDVAVKSIGLITFSVEKRAVPTISVTNSSFSSPSGTFSELTGSYPTRTVSATSACTRGITDMSLPSATTYPVAGGWIASAEL